jgi:hypothetical protein
MCDLWQKKARQYLALFRMKTRLRRACAIYAVGRPAGFRASKNNYAPSIRTILGVKEPRTSTNSRWLAITVWMSL